MLDEYMTESACSHIPSCTAPSSKTVDPLSNQLSVLASSTVQRRAMSPHVHDKTAQSMCEEKVQSTLAGMKQHSTTAPESGTDKKAIEQESPVSPGRNITCGYTCKERQQAVPVWHEDDLTYEQFVNDFMQPNLPVMIQGMTSEWKSSKDWVTVDGNVNIDFLAERFGQAQVMVSDTSRCNAACAPRLDMTVAEFAHWWKMHKAGQDDRLLYLKDWHFANEFPDYKAYQTPCYFQEDWLNEFYDMRQASPRHDAVSSAPAGLGATAVGRPSTSEDGGRSMSADQHGSQCNTFDTKADAVQPHDMNTAHQSEASPAADDIACQSGEAKTADVAHSEYQFQEPLDEEARTKGGSDVVSSDYRFAYLGCKGTWTPLHADVLRSYSWSTNVTGRKKWKLLPPEYTHLLYDRFGREMAATFDVGQPEGRARFPNLDRACRHVIECTQEAGETLFVPSGWHHTVQNLEDTLSINHNWLNSYNIHWAWALLQQEHTDATMCIEDCREGCSSEEFEALVQRNMAANCGMNFAFMANFLHTILHREERMLRQSSHLTAAQTKHSRNIAKTKWILSELCEEHSTNQ